MDVPHCQLEGDVTMERWPIFILFIHNLVVLKAIFPQKSQINVARASNDGTMYLQKRDNDIHLVLLLFTDISTFRTKIII